MTIYAGDDNSIEAIGGDVLGNVFVMREKFLKKMEDSKLEEELKKN